QLSRSYSTRDLSKANTHTVYGRFIHLKRVWLEIENKSIKETKQGSKSKGCKSKVKEVHLER
ncbi:hypothetical protein LINPERHAP1_LOCUS18191, partial [Linum perenne]